MLEPVVSPLPAWAPRQFSAPREPRFSDIDNRGCEFTLTAMNNIVADSIQTWHIDSFQKLRLVLFLHQHPNWWGTSQEFACRLHLGNVPLMDQIFRELRMVGLVDGVADRYKLHNDPDVNLSFQCLARAVEDPLERQAVLDRITVSEHSERYLEHAHELYR